MFILSCFLLFPELSLRWLSLNFGLFWPLSCLSYHASSLRCQLPLLDLPNSFPVVIVADDAADLIVVAALAGVPAAVVVTAVVVAEKRSFHPLRFLVD